MHKHVFEAVDRTIKDIMKQINPEFENIAFGNKVIVFGGDFRQTLPVIKRGTKQDIINACINNSYLWSSNNHSIIILKLNINMRVKILNETPMFSSQLNSNDNEFSDWLLRIGEGTEPTYTDPISGFKDIIKLPEAICKKMTEGELIRFTYPHLHTK